MNELKKIIKNNTREFSVVLAIVIMFTLFGILDSSYLAFNNLRMIFEQSTIYGLMGLGMTAVIITGGIDLSVGSVLAVVGCVVAQLAVAGLNPWLCIAVGLIIGFSCGALNGILVSKSGLQPFIATMGTMSILRGVAYVATGGYPVLGVPDSIKNIMYLEIIPGTGIRTSMVIFILMVVVMYIILRKTKLGIYAYAIGGNEEASKLSGIKVDTVKIIIYGLGMCCTAFAGMIQIGMMGTGDPTTGQGYELNAIAAAAIGGTCMAGGRGNPIGTLLGAILFAGLRVGLIVLRVDTFYQYIATGLVIVVAAYIEVLQSRATERTRKK